VKRASALFAVLAVLVLGVIVGIMGTHLFYAQKFRRAGSFSGMASDFFSDRLERELGLTPEQRRAIDEIMEESRLEGHALREEMRPRVTEMMRRTSERIGEVLTPEQRERFAELQEQHRGRAERFLLGPPGGRGPGRRGGPGWDGGPPPGPPPGLEPGRGPGSPPERPAEPPVDPPPERPEGR
jgi:Spy/CpxP family protein refolding chaperone